MATTRDPETFEKRWNKHIDDLYALHNTLPPEHWDELEEHIDELKDLTATAAEDFEDE